MQLYEIKHNFINTIEKIKLKDVTNRELLYKVLRGGIFLDKIKYVVPFVIILLFTLCVYESMFIMPILAIEKLSLVDDVVNDRSWDTIEKEYGLNSNEIENLIKNNIKLKKVRISCKCDNKAFFNNIDDVGFIFEKNQELPDIIVGKHPATGFLTPINIKSNKVTHIGIVVLIDQKEYTEEQIIDMLKKVKIVMVREVKGETKIESKPVALEIGLES